METVACCKCKMILPDKVLYPCGHFVCDDCSGITTCKTCSRRIESAKDTRSLQFYRQFVSKGSLSLLNSQQPLKTTRTPDISASVKGRKKQKENAFSSSQTPLSRDQSVRARKRPSKKILKKDVTNSATKSEDEEEASPSEPKKARNRPGKLSLSTGKPLFTNSVRVTSESPIRPDPLLPQPRELAKTRKRRRDADLLIESASIYSASQASNRVIQVQAEVHAVQSFSSCSSVGGSQQFEDHNSLVKEESASSSSSLQDFVGFEHSDSAENGLGNYLNFVARSRRSCELISTEKEVECKFVLRNISNDVTDVATQGEQVASENCSSPLDESRFLEQISTNPCLNTPHSDRTTADSNEEGLLPSIPAPSPSGGALPSETLPSNVPTAPCPKSPFELVFNWQRSHQQLSNLLFSLYRTDRPTSLARAALDVLIATLKTTDFLQGCSVVSPLTESSVKREEIDSFIDMTTVKVDAVPERGIRNSFTRRQLSFKAPIKEALEVESEDIVEATPPKATRPRVQLLNDSRSSSPLSRTLVDDETPRSRLTIVGNGEFTELIDRPRQILADIPEERDDASQYAQKMPGSQPNTTDPAVQNLTQINSTHNDIDSIVANSEPTPQTEKKARLALPLEPVYRPLLADIPEERNDASQYAQKLSDSQLNTMDPAVQNLTQINSTHNDIDSIVANPEPIQQTTKEAEEPVDRPRQIHADIPEEPDDASQCTQKLPDSQPNTADPAVQSPPQLMTINTTHYESDSIIASSEQFQQTKKKARLALPLEACNVLSDVEDLAKIEHTMEMTTSGVYGERLIAAVKFLCKQTAAHFNTLGVTERTTHLIVADDEGSINVTAKFLKALYIGSNIITVNWVKDSLKSRTLQPTAPYVPNHLGIKRRTCFPRNSSLFANFVFYLSPEIVQFDDYNYSALKELMEFCNCKIVGSLGDIAHQAAHYRAVILRQDCDFDLPAAKASGGWYQVSYKWFYASLTAYQIQPLDRPSYAS